MTSTVYKYQLFFGSDGAAEVLLPANSQVLDIAFQGGDVCLWALFQKKDVNNLSPAVFCVYGTGNDINRDGLIHIKTIFDRQFVWHIFRVVS